MKKPRNLGRSYGDKTGIRKYREWRGLRDTLIDYGWWCVMWKDMAGLVLGAPVQVLKGILRYRWMFTYLTLPAFIDRQLEGMRGVQLRSGHLLYDLIIKHSIDILSTTFKADQNLGGDRSIADRIVCMDELIPAELMAGFPGLIFMPVQTMPIFLTSMINQQLPPVYLDAAESFGVPADVCPLPSAEAGVAIMEDYPRFGKCFVSCNMPCDGSVMTSSYQDRYFDLPTYPLGIPLRYNEEDAQEYAREELRQCIAFIEEHTGAKWDWEAFRRNIETHNQVTQFHLDMWAMNRTDRPQLTGATPWLYRMYSYQLHGGMDDRFLKNDDKVRRICTQAFLSERPYPAEMRHKALIWSCPANYYSSFSNWLEQCWGIVSVMDMETHISQIIYDTSSPETMLDSMARTFQRATMRKHTKGGYRNVLDELWRVAEEYRVDTIIMYDQISCKGMDGLQGIFDDQARQRELNFIWVKQDLMDCRTISRRDMRNQVSAYMSSVLREDPVDPSLLDFDDSEAY